MLTDEYIKQKENEFKIEVLEILLMHPLIDEETAVADSRRISREAFKDIRLTIMEAEE